MAREIKFRAWNEKHSNLKERMMYGVWLSASGMVQMPDGDYWDIPLMQYTGLKDKNRKDIYEGDIVKTITRIEIPDDYEKKYNREQLPPQIGTVVFNDGMFCWRHHLSKEELTEHQSAFPESDTDVITSLSSFIPYEETDWNNEMVVIGNIYENPELLK